MMAKRSTNLRRRGHIRQRGKSWVVTFRVNGRQVWRSFKTRETAELYLATRRRQSRGANFESLRRSASRRPRWNGSVMVTTSGT
jgi:hypothetical protein